MSAINRNNLTLIRSERLIPCNQWVQVLTLGLIKPWKLILEDKRFYIVELERSNEVIMIDQMSLGSASKVFWKLNVRDTKPMTVVSVPSEFQHNLSLTNIPNFDHKFGEKGGWIFLDFEISIMLTINDESSAICLKRAINPLQRIENEIRTVFAKHCADSNYEEALLTKYSPQVQSELNKNPHISDTGWEIKALQCSRVQGDPKIANSLQKTHDRLAEAIAEAKGKKEQAEVLEAISQLAWERLQEGQAPEKAFEMRSLYLRAIVQALALGGADQELIRSLIPHLMMAISRSAPQGTSDEVRPTGQTLLLEAMEASGHNNSTNLLPPIPRNLPHHERIEWERKLLSERVDGVLPRRDDPYLIEAHLDEQSGRLWTLHWPLDNEPPRIEVDGVDQSQQIFVLQRPEYFSYDKITSFHLYQETRNVLLCRD